MRIGLTSVFVDDQDQAERLYTQVLGHQVKPSAPYGPARRWLTVVASEDPDRIELVLQPTDESARALRAARRGAGQSSRWAPTTAGATPGGSRPKG